MLSLKCFLTNLWKRIFQKDEEYFAVAGYPLVLGQGLNEPRIEPKMAFHWHPPFSVMTAEVARNEKSRFRAWLGKMRIRRKSA
jgi:hypothetical protein